MPMLESTAFMLTNALSPVNINVTAANAADFAPDMPLRADFVYPSGSDEHEALTDYLGFMPGAVKETIRATIYYALTRQPAAPVSFTWRPAYYFSVAVSQWPATKRRQGAINMSVEGPLPRDRFSWVRDYSMAPEAEARASRKLSKRGAPKPAKRKPSNKSKK